MFLKWGIELKSSPARVASIKSQRGVEVTAEQTFGPKDYTPGKPGRVDEFIDQSEKTSNKLQVKYQWNNVEISMK